MADQIEKAAICDGIAILVSAGVMDYNGHVSLRLADGGFLINSGASNRKAMTPDQITHLSAAGKVVSGGRPPNEMALHKAIYARRSDVGAVVHGHPPWSTLFTATEKKIPTVMPQGRLVTDIPVFAKSFSISSAARANEVADSLGQGVGLLLKAHGSVFVGADLIEATVLAIYLEQNAERAFQAQQLGTPRDIAPEVVAEYRKTLRNPRLYRKCWDFHLPRKD